MEKVPPSVRFYVMNRDGFRCRYCGVMPDDGIHIDHIVPRSKGGANHPSNLVTSCIDCNLGKGNGLTRDVGHECCREIYNHIVSKAKSLDAEKHCQVVLYMASREVYDYFCEEIA